MAMRTTPPFRADHVGSLLRPPALLRAREDAAAGRITADELHTVEDEAIAEIGLDAGQFADDVVYPERAAELAVGDRSQADLLLLADD